MTVRLANLNLDNPFVQAPLAGITDPPFRTIARRFHKGLLYSEMVSAEALCRGNVRTRTYFRIDEGHHPIALQIEGSKPDRMAQAARFLESVGADIIDINSGCPDRKLLKEGAGGALLKDLKRLELIAKTVVKAVRTPVSVKLRLGFDKDDSIEILNALADTGVAYLTFNGYTVAQRFSGKSDWDALARLVAAGKEIGLPVIANGGANSECRAVEMLRHTKAALVMIGRATRGRPDLPRTAFSLLETGKFSRMGADLLAKTIHDHSVLEVETYSETKGMLRMRKFLMWYLKAARLKYDCREVNAMTTIKESDAIVEKAINKKDLGQ